MAKNCPKNRQEPIRRVFIVLVLLTAHAAVSSMGDFFYSPQVFPNVHDIRHWYKEKVYDTESRATCHVLSLRNTKDSLQELASGPDIAQDHTAALLHMVAVSFFLATIMLLPIYVAFVSTLLWYQIYLPFLLQCLFCTGPLLLLCLYFPCVSIASDP